MTGGPAAAADADADAVRAANTSLYDAFETGDIDLMSAVWLDDASAGDVTCVHPGWAPVHGRGSVLRSWSMIMANTSYIQFVLTDVDVRICGDVAVVTCGENMLTGLPETDGEPSPGLAGGRAVATNVFRRTSRGWRLWVHHASPVLAGQEPT
ncbi:MAG: nuclear transport factor 2 family protein [Sporichthyaceae bacterium]|nr:nuclear transport factor 2 family protein [Sporichthyaceae bacterium]